MVCGVYIYLCLCLNDVPSLISWCLEDLGLGEWHWVMGMGWVSLVSCRVQREGRVVKLPKIPA